MNGVTDADVVFVCGTVVFNDMKIEPRVVPFVLVLEVVGKNLCFDHT